MTMYYLQTNSVIAIRPVSLRARGGAGAFHVKKMISTEQFFQHFLVSANQNKRSGKGEGPP
jgi:hypothetical protein